MSLLNELSALQEMIPIYVGANKRRPAQVAWRPILALMGLAAWEFVHSVGMGYGPNGATDPK